VKTFVKILGLASLVALAACDSAKENQVENAYENKADAIDNQADNMEAMADNLTGAAENTAEHAADALENKADATRVALVSDAQGPLPAQWRLTGYAMDGTRLGAAQGDIPLAANGVTEAGR